MSDSVGLGSHVRLRSLKPSDLPQHPDLAQFQSNSPSKDPSAFARDVLQEARAFMVDYWPNNFVVKSPSKHSPPSHAAVELLHKDILASDLPQNVRPTGTSGTVESWFARSSIHENKKEQGTAAWDEFEGHLLDNHSENEKEYTPNIYDVHRVLFWDHSGFGDIAGWEKVEMQIFEMCHALPAPLNPRLFTVLVVKGRSTGPQSEFITVQMPVDITQVPQALYANGRNRSEGQTAQQKKATTPGMYISVERGDLLDDGNKVRWQMATASDAGGNLPMWAQRMGVPGAIVKDVGLFLEWMARKRGQSG